jgi:hypothetical protein
VSGARRPCSRRARAIRIAARFSTALLAAVGVYIAVVQLDLVRSPFDPTVRGDLELARSAERGLRVLFVGNSLTYYNDMPALVHELAAADDAAAPLFTVAYAAPNWGLEPASKDDGLDRLLRDVAWDVVVLQERSGLPSLAADERAERMDRFVYELAARIDAVGAETVLFMTWGYEGGDDRSFPNDDFAAMQARVTHAYADLARNLEARVAPVGVAWAEALRRDPTTPLWRRDGRHPSRHGSYLAACVFYALLAERPVEGNPFKANLPTNDARFLQRAAAHVVAEWRSFE